MRLKYLAVSLVILLGSTGLSCTSKKVTEEEKTVQSSNAKNEGAGRYDIAEGKSLLEQYYQQDHLKEWYPERFFPPAFDFNIDLTNKSIVELSFLRNEIFARNGYLFDDAVLRGHFNQFKWYQPIFDVPEFKVQLNKQEAEFVDKVRQRENELLKDRYQKQGDYEMIGLDHVYNLTQFKSVEENLKRLLAINNFAIVPAEHEQFFHVYDNNHYQYIPNFITTDIYLQVLHKHFSAILQKVEEEKFIPLLNTLVEDLYQRSQEFQTQNVDPKLRRAAQWISTYLSVANHLIRGGDNATEQMEKDELEKILGYKGVGSQFLDSDLFQYSQFKPRGNYTKSKELENYFRCVKWLNTAPIFIDEDERLISAILLASFIKNSPQNLQSFQRFNDGLKFIVGEEDNLSIGMLISVLSNDQARNPAILGDAEALQKLRLKLAALNVDRIAAKAGDVSTTNLLNKPSILFTAGRYTFDAEILSRLIHVLRPEPKRPFPKGLDVFASLGNATAKNILLSEYDEGKSWDAYLDSLKVVQSKFDRYSGWDKNIYSKTFETIKSLDEQHTTSPHFMATQAWSRKSLNTALAAWTELKHDMLLYAEQPYAAQAGEGGGPPPPQHISYVEPNIIFWEKSLELLSFQMATLTRMDLLDEKTSNNIQELKEIGALLLQVSKKQLAKESLTADEFDQLTWLGGRIEYLTFKIFDSDHLPEKERFVALVTDVYNYNGIYLEEAVGMVDEIYVIAEINGKPYLTKGAVFSYFEFTKNSPMSDEEWRKDLTGKRKPKRPPWITPIIAESQSLESKPGYSF